MSIIPRSLSIVLTPRAAAALAVVLAAISTSAPLSAADQPATQTSSPAEERKSKVPPFAVVQDLVEKQLAKKSGYRDGDLITRSDVAPIIPQLEKLGFPVREVSKGIEVLLADDHLLVTLLRTPQGEALIPKIKNLELALDRMDRLCYFSEGQELLRNLVVAPNALTVIEQLCLPETAKALAVKYPNEPSCQTLDLPTGRAFTQRQYIERLRTIHMLAERGLTRPHD
ncbi:MAG: hypothetical protein K8U03_18830 [Planctomycetia bacterium]|nr:hypothetical protein [Planctomycetia bacterium]